MFRVLIVADGSEGVRDLSLALAERASCAPSPPPMTAG